MNNWIPSHVELAEHPKTKRLARKLGVSLPSVLGHLHLLWHWCFKYAPKGDLSGFDVEEIAEAAHWESEASAFMNTCIEVGFIDDDKKVHDWYDYGGKYIEQKEKEAERGRRRRAGAKENNGSVRRMSDGRPVAEENKREEKKEEEKIIENPLHVVEEVNEEEFHNFWEQYPKKKSKPESRAEWAKLSPDASLVSDIMSGLENAKASGDWKKDDGKWIPHPAKWLREEKWEDDYSSVPFEELDELDQLKRMYGD